VSRVYSRFHRPLRFSSMGCPKRTLADGRGLQFAGGICRRNSHPRGGIGGRGRSQPRLRVFCTVRTMASSCCVLDAERCASLVTARGQDTLKAVTTVSAISLAGPHRPGPLAPARLMRLAPAREGC
jgi:hypothetical protein